MVRVLIVEHFATTAAVIRTLLADSTRVAIVGEAADASGALSLLERLRPDVVVLDGALGHRDGHSLVRQMKETQPAARLTVLSAHPAPLPPAPARRRPARRNVTSARSLPCPSRASPPPARRGRGCGSAAPTRRAGSPRRGRRSARRERRSPCPRGTAGPGGARPWRRPARADRAGASGR